MKVLTTVLLLLCLTRDTFGDFAGSTRVCAYFHVIFSHGTVFFPREPTRRDCKACSIIIRKSGSEYVMMGDCYHDVGMRCYQEDPQYGDAVRCTCSHEELCNAIPNNTMGQYYMDKFNKFSTAPVAEKQAHVASKLSCRTTEVLYSRTDKQLRYPEPTSPVDAPCSTLCGLTVRNAADNQVSIKTYCHKYNNTLEHDLKGKCYLATNTDTKTMVCGCDSAVVSGYCNDMSVAPRARLYVHKFDTFFSKHVLVFNGVQSKCLNAEYIFHRDKHEGYGEVTRGSRWPPNVTTCDTVCGFTMSQDVDNLNKFVINSYCHDVPYNRVKYMKDKCTTMRVQGLKSIVCACYSGEEHQYCNEMVYPEQIHQYVEMFDARWMEKPMMRPPLIKQCVREQWMYSRKTKLTTNTYGDGTHIPCETVCGITVEKIDEDKMALNSYCHEIPQSEVQSLTEKCPILISIRDHKQIICGCNSTNVKRACNNIAARARSFVHLFDSMWTDRN